MAMLGKRFLAILGVVALGAGSAMVGITMASGSWNVVGAGLDPGQGYGVLIGSGNDRMKLELANVTSDPAAWFSVWSPDGTRAGFFQLDGSTRSAEIVVGNGPWLVFVYKAHGGDLTMSVHGTAAAPPMAAADVERREVTLGSEDSAQTINKTYAAVLAKEPALAGVYLQGSASQFHSELRTDKGPVEVVDDQSVDAVQSGVYVESKGERTTMPQNLQAGSYAANVSAQELRGTLVLVALYLKAPDFAQPAPAAAPDASDSSQAQSSGNSSSASSGHHSSSTASAEPAASCGTAHSRVPYGLDAPGKVTMRLTLNSSDDPQVSVYDPSDDLLKVVELKKQGDTAKVALAQAGQYVIYSRGADVDVSLLHASACKLVKLKTDKQVVAMLQGDVVSSTLGNSTQAANFTLKLPPLEFGIEAQSPDAVVLNGDGTFTGPKGQGAETQISFASGLTGNAGLGGLFGPSDGGSNGMSSSSTQVNATGLVRGAWDLQFQATELQGTLDAWATHYVRGNAASDDDHN